MDIQPEFEFRVFVFNNKITAISQQNIYSLVYNNYLENENIFNEFMKKKLDIIVNYFYEKMIQKIFVECNEN